MKWLCKIGIHWWESSGVQCAVVLPSPIIDQEPTEPMSEDTREILNLFGIIPPPDAKVLRREVEVLSKPVFKCAWCGQEKGRD